MAIKTYKPTTPGRRGMTVIDYSGLSKVEPCKSLLEPLKKNSGRNSYGRITVRHRGGGVRRKYRVIDFKRNKLHSSHSFSTRTVRRDTSSHLTVLLLAMLSEQAQALTSSPATL